MRGTVRRSAGKYVAACCAVLLGAAVLVVSPAPAGMASGDTEAPPSTASEQQSCACTGAFVAPKVVTPAVTAGAAPDSNGYSQKKTYQVQVAANGLTVVRVTDGVQVLSLSPVPSDWVFSPDEQRFVTVAPGAITLYDLSQGGKQLFQLANPQDTDFGFSSGGKYLSLSSLPEQVPTLQVIDAHTGATVFLGGSNVVTGFTNFGFSPDQASIVAWSDSSTKVFALPSGDVMWQSAGPPAAYGFSPKGGYLEAKTVTNTTHVSIAVIDLSDGSTAYETEYDFQEIPYAGASPTPSPSPSPSPKDTAEPTDTADPSPSSVASSPVPTNTSDPFPTQDPVPTNTSDPLPTDSGMPTQSAFPSQSALPSDTSNPYPTQSAFPTQNPVPGSPSATPAPTPAASPSSTSSPTKGKGKGTTPALQEESSGFSPDGNTYVDAYVNGEATAALAVVNLRGHKTILSDDQIDRASFWEFSPCGGTFGRVVPNDDDQTATLYSTYDGRVVGSANVPFTTVKLTANADNEIVSYTDSNGTTQNVTLAQNLWCPAPTINYYPAIFGGTSQTWSITLDRPAHDYGVTFPLASNTPDLTVPAQVSVAAGQTSTSFTVTSTATPEDVHATVTVTYLQPLGGSESTPVTVVVATVPVDYVSLDESSVTGPAQVNGSVELSQSAPTGGVIVDLSSDNAAVTVPATVTVPAGSTTADFVADVAAVTGPATVTISATSGATTAAATLDVEPVVATTTAIAVSPAGGVAVAGETVSLTANVTPVSSADTQDTVPSGGPPTGTVTFTDGTTTLATVDVSPVSGSYAYTANAVFSTSDLAAGDHSITASYSGDPNYQPSSATTTVTVGAGLTWTGGGGDGKWSDPANWDGDRAPVADDVLVINASSPLTVDDDISGLAVRGLHLTGPVTVGGRPVTLDGDIDAFGDVATVDNDLVLAAGTHPLATDHELYLPGAISGAGGLSVSTASNSFVVLDGTVANSYSGETDVTAGSSLFVAQGDALGSTASGTTVAGTLCIADGVSVAEPVVSDGGDVAACDTLDGLTAELDGDDYDPYAYSAHPTATLTGALDDEGGVSFGPYACYAARSGLSGPFSEFGVDVGLEVDGPVSGPGNAAVGCGASGDTNATVGAVAFGGTAANTYRGGTEVTSTLTLGKAASVVALPGDATGRGEVVLGGDDPIAHSADVEIQTLDLAGHQATVASLDAALDATVQADGSSGRVHVTGGVTVSSVGIRVGADPAVGTVMTIVDNQTTAPIGECPNASVVSGSSTTSYRLNCEAGDGNDLAVTTIWRSTITLTPDPLDGVQGGHPVTVTAAVNAPAGGTTPTGQATLEVYTYNSNWEQWVYQQSVATADVVDGVATFQFPDTSFLGAGNGLVASYVGDSAHAPVDSAITRYVTWSTPASSLPGVPTGLGVDPSGPGTTNPDSAYVSWGYPAGSSRTDFISYRINVTPQGGQPYIVDTATMGDPSVDMQYGDYPTFPQYRVEGLTPGQTYTFTVQAVNSAGAGPATDPVTVTIPTTPPATAPGVPTNVLATAGPGQVSLSWSAPADDGGARIDSYVITPYLNGVAQADIWTATAATSVTLAGLTPGTAYTFRVAAANIDYVGGESKATSVVTPTALPAGIGSPGAPSEVSAAPAGLGEITISWTAPTDDGGSPIVGYAITPSDSYGSWGQFLTSGDSTSVTMTDLPAADQLTFTVAAVNAAGAGPDSGPTAPVAPGDGSGDNGGGSGETSVPEAPTGVTATAGPAQVFLTWTAPADDGGAPIDHYVVTPYVGGTAQAPITLTGSGTSATIGALLPGVAYTFTVAAVNSNGTGPESAQTTAATPSDAAPVTNTPTAPVDATLNGTGQNVTLTWTKPDSDGGSPLTGYEVIEWSAKSANFDPWSDLGGAYSFGESGSWWVPAGTTSLDITTPTISSPWSQGAYWFTVTAANGIGFGPQSVRSNGVDAVWVAPGGGYVGGPGIGLPPEPTAPPGQNGDISNGAGGAADGGGFAPGEPVDATMHSTPIDLGTFTAGADGTVHATFTVPADLPPGDHTIELTGLQSGHDDVIPITVVQRLTISDVTSSSFTVGWPAPTDGDGVTGFTVNVDGVDVATLPASTTSYDATGLTPASSHTVTVRAEGANGDLGKAADVVTTLSGLDAKASAGAVQLTWTASSDSTVTGYRVLRATDGGDLAPVADVTGAAATSYTDSGLSASTTYSYQVLAVHSDGSTSVWSDVASATTPDLAVTGVTFSAPSALGGGATYGAQVSIELTGDPGRSASAQVATESPEGTSNTSTVALGETSPGVYDGTLSLDTSIAKIDGITGVLTDGVHTASAAASGLPLTQGGELSIDIAAPNVATPGLQLELLDSALGIDDLRSVTAPGQVDVAVAPGSWSARLVTPDGDVVAQQASVAVSAATAAAVTLTPVRHSTLTVDLAAPSGQPAGGFTVTVTDANGTVLGQSDVALGQSSATFSGLVAGTPVTVTATLDDATRPLLSTVTTTATLTGGADDVQVVEQALPTGVLTGTVSPRGSTATVTVAEQVDGRSWQFTTSTGSDGTYTVSALAAASAHVVVDADGFEPTSFDVTIGDGSTVTAPPVTLQPVAAQPVPTTLILDRFDSLRDLIRLLLGRYRVTAHLTRSDTGAPIDGQPVVIDSRLGRFCVATTDVTGTASCPVPARLAVVVMLNQVHASYAGSPAYLPSEYGPGSLTVSRPVVGRTIR